MKNIVILGGGYGGQSVAKQLLQYDLPDHIGVTLVDRMPYQGLKTEYYALASGTIADMAIRVPFPNDTRLQIRYGDVTNVDLNKKLIYFAERDPIPYDWLAIALGCTDNFHGIEGAEQYANSIQTLTSTRMTYQKTNEVTPYGQVTIVGGGLSGVEVAAELRESRPDLNVRIVDRGASILSSFPLRLQEYVRTWFIEHDVEMLGNVSISRLEQGVLYDSSEPIYTDCIIWTAGIQPNKVVQRIDLPKDKQGRLIVDEFHQLPSHPGVFVVGDCASLPFSPSAQAAEGQGKQVAEVMRALWRGETPRLGQIKLKGVLGSLGKKSGFGMMGKHSIIGRVPRVIKSGVLWISKNHFG